MLFVARVAYGRAGVNGPFAAELLEPAVPSPRICGFLGPGSGWRDERLEAFGTLLALGVQRLVAL